MCPFEELASTIAKIQDCVSDLDNNKLKLNKENPELLYRYSKHSPIKSVPPLRFVNDTIHPSDSARNIGATLYHLVNISCIRKFLFSKTAEILVHTFVCSKLDFCNSLLYYLPKYVLKKLQSAKNAAARLTACSRKYDHITSVLSDLQDMASCK